MKKFVSCASLTGASFPMLALDATAQTQSDLCAPREQVAQALAINHGEEPVSGGIHGGAALLEVFVSKSEKTWSIIITQADGTSCIVAAGTDWIDRNLLPLGIPG